MECRKFLGGYRKMSNETVKGDPFLMTYLFGHDDFREGVGENGSLAGDEVCKLGPDGLDTGESEVHDPVGGAIKKFEADKAGAVDPGWSEPIGRVTAPPSNFIQNSDARFERVRAALKKVFGDAHEEEFQETVAIAKQIRAEARGEAMNAAVVLTPPGVTAVPRTGNGQFLRRSRTWIRSSPRL
jgi:hypothetical protein